MPENIVVHPAGAGHEVVVAGRQSGRLLPPKATVTTLQSKV
jgi:hypothetical protein